MSATGCPTIEELDRYVSGRAPGRRLREHLEACPACSERLARVQQNERLLGELLAACDDGDGVDGVGPAGAPRVEGYRVLAGALLAELRRDALPWTEAERRRDRATHPLVPELETKRRRVRALERDLQRVAAGDLLPTEEEVIGHERELAALGTEITDLEGVLSRRRTYTLADGADPWWHHELAGLACASAGAPTSRAPTLAARRTATWCRRATRARRSACGRRAPSTADPGPGPSAASPRPAARPCAPAGRP